MTDSIKLPIDYPSATAASRRKARYEYIDRQDGDCYWCHESLKYAAPSRITEHAIDWSLFPKHFLSNPIHLQHDHKTGQTEGAVHAYCNAVMWQYHGR